MSPGLFVDTIYIPSCIHVQRFFTVLQSVLADLFKSKDPDAGALVKYGKRWCLLSDNGDDGDQLHDMYECKCNMRSIKEHFEKIFKCDTPEEHHRSLLTIFCIVLPEETRRAVMEGYDPTSMDKIYAYAMVLFQEVRFMRIFDLQHIPFMYMQEHDLKRDFFATWRTTVLTTCEGMGMSSVINRNQYLQMQQHPAFGHTCCFKMLMEVLGYQFSDDSPLPRFSGYSPLAIADYQ